MTKDFKPDPCLPIPETPSEIANDKAQFGLENGDFEPFLDLLRSNFPIGRELRYSLIQLITARHEIYSLRFARKKGKRTIRERLALYDRDQEIGKYVADRSETLSYGKAIEAVAEKYKIGNKHVEKAFTTHKKGGPVLRISPTASLDMPPIEIRGELAVALNGIDLTAGLETEDDWGAAEHLILQSIAEEAELDSGSDVPPPRLLDLLAVADAFFAARDRYRSDHPKTKPD